MSNVVIIIFVSFEKTATKWMSSNNHPSNIWSRLDSLLFGVQVGGMPEECSCINQLENAD